MTLHTTSSGVRSSALLTSVALALALSGCASQGTNDSAGHEFSSLHECVVGEWEVDADWIEEGTDADSNWEYSGYSRLTFTDSTISHDVDYTQTDHGESDGEEWTYEAQFEGTSQQDYRIEGNTLIYGQDTTEGVVRITQSVDGADPVVRESVWGVPPTGTEAPITCDATTLTIDVPSYGTADTGEEATVYKRI